MEVTMTSIAVEIEDNRTPTLLRRALMVDGAISGITGALMLFGAGPLTGLLGLPASLLQWAGVSLFPFAGWLFYLATRERIARSAALAVIGCNVLWAVASVLLLVSGWVEPTLLGYLFTIAQALAVAAFAEIQYMGVRRSA
jgi:hypothetical protein